MSEDIQEEKKFKGPRPIVFIALKIINDELVVERCVSPSGADVTREQVFAFSESNVKEIFQEKHNSSPELIIGPFYDVKALQPEIQTKKTSKIPEVPMAELQLVDNSCRIVECEGWQGLSYKIKNREDVLLFIPNFEINSSLLKNKKTPKIRTVPITACHFLANSNNN